MREHHAGFCQHEMHTKKDARQHHVRGHRESISHEAPAVATIRAILLGADDLDTLVLEHARAEEQRRCALGIDGESNLLLHTASAQHAAANVLVGKIHLQCPPAPPQDTVSSGSPNSSPANPGLLI